MYSIDLEIQALQRIKMIQESRYCNVLNLSRNHFYYYPYNACYASLSYVIIFCRTAWFSLPPLKPVASLQAAVGQVGWAGKGSVLSARPPSFPGAGGYFMINLNHDSKAMCRPSEITRRTLGPLDKRKKTTRCQPCANRRVKV